MIQSIFFRLGNNDYCSCHLYKQNLVYKVLNISSTIFTLKHFLIFFLYTLGHILSMYLY